MTEKASKRKSVDFQGAIEVVTIEGVLQLLYYANLTGKLILLNPPAKATFYFNRGTLIWGTLHAQQKQLGQRLLDSLSITPEQLKECLTLHISEKQRSRLGTILINKGFVQTDKLLASLKDQVREAFFEVLGWTSGTFAFISEIDSPEEEIALNERIDHLLLEGVIHLDDSSALSAKISTR